MAATLRIEQLSAKDVRRLSTGERQRFAIARAGSGAAIVADEPKGGLDREGIIAWRGILQQALSAGHPAIVIATHQLSPTEGLPLNVVQLARDAGYQQG
jgi:ABC-type lipoprotein export system ATPase subunit